VAGRDEVIAYANELLRLDDFPDYGPMGLQVAGDDQVERIGCGVSASLELFERAADAGVNLLLVHHGLFWDSDPRTIDDRMRRKLEALFRARISLAAYHLALDAHPEIGNNALLARELGIEVDAPFGGIGVGGTIPGAIDPAAFVQRVAERVGRTPTAFLEGPERVERVAVITGGAARYVNDAAHEGYDLFVTGEPAEPTLHTARELRIHFVAAGHYATERLGVQALAARLAERYALDWQFIEVPNPV
jgi:dinuclear metal center YbgI/SA1388 family protein